MENIENSKWWYNATIYEIFPKSFSDSTGNGIGDINGIISKLDYLEYLGIDAIWLCPIFVSEFKDSGYDVENYYDINPMFGNLDDFELLIKKAHEKNIKVILDITLNHTSDKHPWFISACESESSPYRNYYIFNKRKEDRLPNNWISSRTLKSVWTPNEKTDDYYLHIYTKHQPDLNWHNKDLREELYKILRFWLDKGVDGFRFDVINKIVKAKGLPDIEINPNNVYADYMFENQEDTHKYIKEMRSEVFSKYEDVLLLGQTGGVDEKEAVKFAAESRHELDLFLQFDYIDIDKGPDARKKTWTVKELKSYIMKWQNLVRKNVWPTVFFSSHDTSRAVNRYGNSNRKYKNISAKMIAAIQICLQGTQIIYMGDEFGLTNKKRKHIDDFEDIKSKDIYSARIKSGESKKIILDDLKHLARDNARDDIPWNICQKQTSNSRSVFSFYKSLLEMRKKEEALLYGKTIPILDNILNVFAYQREYDKVIITVIANMSKKEIAIDLREFGTNIVMNNYKTMNSTKLKEYEVRIYKMEK